MWGDHKVLVGVIKNVLELGKSDIMSPVNIQNSMSRSEAAAATKPY